MFWVGWEQGLAALVQVRPLAARAMSPEVRPEVTWENESLFDLDLKCLPFQVGHIRRQGRLEQPRLP
jgi:hypothetical protein